MDVVRVENRPPSLRRPVLVAAFTGWNDAGDAASSALAALRAGLDAQQFAHVDPEEFIDFQVTRPQVRLVQDGQREVVWPRLRLSWARLPGQDRDVVLFEGSEPNLRWRTFTSGVLDFVRDLDVGLVVVLGALQVDAPHTRPVPITGSVSDDGLGERLGLRRSRYEGPTGIVGVLTAAAADAGLDAVSFWAGVPHYLAALSYAPGALALAERVTDLLSVDVSLDVLARRALAQQDEIGSLVADDSDLAEYVAELEARTDDTDTDDLPAVSGEELAAELERYLKDRRDR